MFPVYLFPLVNLLMARKLKFLVFDEIMKVTQRTVGRVEDVWFRNCRGPGTSLRSDWKSNAIRTFLHP